MAPRRLKSGEAQRGVLTLIRDPHASLYDTALAYRKLLQTPGRYDWEGINNEIKDRWSEEGWMRMMRVAWEHQLTG